MGNCQAAEAATVVIQHPGGRVERAYWSLTASQVMAANPGHYVAVIIVAPPPSALNSAASSSSACHDSGGGRGARVKHLRLLRANDTLHIGHVYRLVSFQDVLREFASKGHVKLSRLLAKPTEMASSSSTRGNGSGAALCRRPAASVTSSGRARRKTGNRGSKSGYRAEGGGARDDGGGDHRRHPDNEGQSWWSSTGTAWAVEASLAEHCRGRKLSYSLRLF